MRFALVAVVLALGCGKGPKTPPASREVQGTLTVDGTPRSPLACRPQRGARTFVEVVAPTGVLRFEDAQLYWRDDPAASPPGARLACDKLDRSWGGGSRADGTAYWRGTLSFACAAGPNRVTGDLTLDCGNITAAERAQLDANRRGLLDEQRRRGSGTAAPVDLTP